MSQITGTTSIGNDDLICPITFELFRDPVVAGDGHVYEREAITQWILEHGTSPFTREPLQVNHLQPDDHLRRLAAQRRNSTVSYNVQNGSVRLPPLRQGPTIITQAIPAIRPNQIQINLPSKKNACKITCFCIIFVGSVVVIILAFTFGTQNLNSNSTSTVVFIPEIMSNYSSSLTNTSVFIRSGQTTGQYYYKSIQFFVSTSGYYTFRSVSDIDMYGYLYNQSFNATAPSINLLTYDNNSGGSQQFYFGTLLQSGNYTLVATTYSGNVIGNFSIIVYGPANIIFR